MNKIGQLTTTTELDLYNPGTIDKLYCVGACTRCGGIYKIEFGDDLSPCPDCVDQKAPDYTPEPRRSFNSPPESITNVNGKEGLG